MSSDQVINQIIQTIVTLATEKTRNETIEQEKQSKLQNYQITDTLAAFMIRAIVLDPNYGFNAEKEMSREQVNRLIDVCVSKITSSDFEMETIRMQVYFDTNFPSQSDFLHREHMVHLEQCAGLLREIVQVKSKQIPSLEALNRKIVSFVLLRSNVGIPTDMRVIREATAALESVFPNSELISFIGLTRQEKEQQLNGLTNLVTGIRLFNRYLEKGGETIQDYPFICATEMKELQSMLRQEMVKTETLIQQSKAVLDYAHGKQNTEVTEEMYKEMTQSLVFRRQYLLYLDAIMHEANQSQSHLNQLQTKYEQSIQELKVACKSKSAVPVDQVYPLFITLASTWYTWYDELFMISFKKGIMETLQKSSKVVDITISPILVTLSEGFNTEIEPAIVPDQEIIQNASVMMTELGMVNKNADVLHPGNTTQYFQLPVEFGGFCPTNLIKRDGLVVPGDKNLGMVRFKERLFTFSSIHAAIEFFKNPDQCIEDIIQMSRTHPSYVQLLHLYKFFPSVDTLDKAQSYTRQRLLGQLPIVTEVGCQVDTHIEEPKLDKKYKWNEWDLRREALMLVNLKDKKTHSSQTDQSHFRRESETQHYNARETTTQTRRDHATFVPRTVHYLAGLRNDGQPKPGNMYKRDREIHFHVRDLTIDQDGKPVPYGGGAFAKKPVKKDAAV